MRLREGSSLTERQLRVECAFTSGPRGDAKTGMADLRLIYFAITNPQKVS